MLTTIKSSFKYSCLEDISRKIFVRTRDKLNAVNLFPDTILAALGELACSPDCVPNAVSLIITLKRDYKPLNKERPSRFRIMQSNK